MSGLLETLLDRGSQSPAKTALLVSSALAVAGYAAFSFFGGAGSSELAPALTEEEAREMMKGIFDRIKVRVPQLLRAAEGIKQQIAAQGQEISDAQLMQMFILPHFESAVTESTAEVLEEYDADEDELEEAVNAYVDQGDKDLTEITKSMIVMYQQFGGTVESEPSASAIVNEISLEDFLEMMHELAEGIIENSTTFVRGWVEERGRPSSASEKEAFQTQLMMITENVEKELLSSRGLTTTDLHQLLMKHQNSQQVQQIFLTMQVQNQRILQNYGITV